MLATPPSKRLVSEVERPTILGLVARDLVFTVSAFAALSLPIKANESEVSRILDALGLGLYFASDTQCCPFARVGSNSCLIASARRADWGRTAPSRFRCVQS